ncbi:hypothetical protein INT02_11195 [Prosthecochloris sp. N2]|uniref:hypothetical protein n=1 Tax=Prosthecochloris ethylica TaxID=2743976 RepID=UPI00158378A4|nr:hypothetical protein [Prosthecochloris ethylica]MBF0587458.1 hypothetical protein [Prosthecochloris ethylica]NUK48688.1 hypothetical protein [Prosthecochloris ethylica]
MKRSQHLIQGSTIIAVFSVILLTACSNDLSRIKAKSLIVKHNNFPISEYYELEKNHFKMLEKTGAVIAAPMKKEVEEILQYLENNKLIEIQRKRKESSTWMGRYVGHKMMVFIPKKNKKYILKENKHSYNLKTCDINFHKITGIKTYNDYNYAEVEYELKRENWTPFGEFFKTKKPSIIKKNVTMVLYDDGWRIR